MFSPLWPKRIVHFKTGKLSHDFGNMLPFGLEVPQKNKYNYETFQAIEI